MRQTTRFLGLLAALALFGTACAGSSTTRTEAAAGTSGEGIGVHGHWTLEVADADGTVTSTHEFENALTARGEEMLAMMVGGLYPSPLMDMYTDRDVPVPSVFIEARGPLLETDPCDDGSAEGVPCRIYVGDVGDLSDDDRFPPGSFATAEISTDDPSSSEPDDVFTMSGSFEVANSTSIVSVVTGIERFCLLQSFSSPCDPFNLIDGGELTFKNLDSPQPVEAGQFVTITVEISFGTL